MIFHVVYLKDTTIMFSGNKKQCENYHLKAYRNHTAYSVLSDQQIRQLTWEF